MHGWNSIAISLLTSLVPGKFVAREHISHCLQHYVIVERELIPAFQLHLRLLTLSQSTVGRIELVSQSTQLTLVTSGLSLPNQCLTSRLGLNMGASSHLVSFRRPTATLSRARGCWCNLDLWRNGHCDILDLKGLLHCLLGVMGRR